MTPPRKAFILAAGLGTRFRPLTDRLPKPLLPFWGIPLLDRIISQTASWGVREVLVNLHHRSDAVLAHCLARGTWPVRLQFSYEPELLGTGGSLVRAAWFLDGDPFWLVNSDIVADLDPLPLLRRHARRRPLATLWMTDAAGPRTVTLDGERVATFRAAQPGAPGTFTFCGLHLLTRETLDFLPPEGPAGIVEAYEKAIAAGKTILGCRVPGAQWADLGTVGRYLDAHRDFAPQPGQMAGATPGRPRGFVSVQQPAVVSPRARMSDSVLMAGCRIGPRADIHNAVVAPGASVDGYAEGLVLSAADAGDELARRIALRLRWDPADTMLAYLPARGSARTFTRMVCRKRTVILTRYSPDRAENALYARNAVFLRRLGVPVPRVLMDLPRERATVFEDVGHSDLLSVVRGARAGDWPLDLYRSTLAAMSRMHREGPRAAAGRRLRLSPSFTATLFGWEHALFSEQFLVRRRGWPPEQIRPVLDELRCVARALRREPRVLLHRDLQSTNVMVRAGEPIFIDFQGMRLGPALYDVASLLCDPYVSLPADVQDELLESFARLSDCDPRRLQRRFRQAAVQRLVQAIGAYARLGREEDTRRFAAHIPPALAMLHRMLQGLDELPSLRKCVEQATREET